MKAQSLGDLLDFHRFVGEKVKNGGDSLSPEEVLDEWRFLHPEPEAVEVEAAAIQEAIDDIENGDVGVSFEAFDRDFRAERLLVPRA